MSTKAPYFTLVLASLCVACASNAASSNESPPSQPQPQAAETAPPTGEGSEPVLQPPQATLTVQRGQVEVRHTGEPAYTQVEGAATLGSGARVRTGEDGLAVVTFLDQTTTIIHPNSEFVINSFERNDEGKFVIALEQLLGVSFNRIDDFPDAIAQHELATPYGKAAVRGTAYWVEVDSLLEVASFDVTRGEVDITYQRDSQEQHATADAGQTIDVHASGEVTTRDLDLRCDSASDEQCHHPAEDERTGLEEENLGDDSASEPLPPANDATAVPTDSPGGGNVGPEDDGSANDDDTSSSEGDGSNQSGDDTSGGGVVVPPEGNSSGGGGAPTN